MRPPPLLFSHSHPGTAQQSPCPFFFFFSFPFPLGILHQLENKVIISCRTDGRSCTLTPGRGCIWVAVDLPVELAWHAAGALAMSHWGGSVPLLLSPPLSLLSADKFLQEHLSCFLATELEYLDQQISTRACLGDS